MRIYSWKGAKSDTIQLVTVSVHTVEGEMVHFALELVSTPPGGIVVNMKSFLNYKKVN